ncbi:MAG: glycoside hydrolase family 16 protein [Clostridia bacterium]|nr:glycoside hydrolase family 16 protein [Clostridia bacterium]
MLDKIYELLQLSYREIWAVEKLFEYARNLFTGFSFKGFFSGIMAIIEILQMLIFGLPLTPRGQALDLTGYNVVVYDEFEGDTLNTDIWEYRGNGARRGGFNASSQVEVRDGNLVIAGEYLTDGEYGEGWYTAAIKLRKRYKNGYFEIKCKVNEGAGYWSAFWIQADSPYTASVSKGGVGGAELDIFESKKFENKEKYCITHAIHCAGVDGVQDGFQSNMLGSFYGNDITNEYNTYGLEWTEEEYIFYVNGVETVRSTFGNGVSQVEEDVIVSLEIPDPEKLGTLDKENYKTEFIVDYVKIYQK